MIKKIMYLIILSVFLLIGCESKEENLNIEKNKMIYDEFIEDYKNYENKIKEADSYIFTSNVKYKIKDRETDEVINKKEKYSNFKVSWDPFYIETNSKEDKILSTTVLNEKDGYIYVNDVTSKNSIDSDRLIPKEKMNYEAFKYIGSYINNKFYFDYEYDVKLGNVKKSINSYKFTQEYNYLLSTKIGYIDSLFSFIGIEKKDVLKMTVNTNVTFLNKILHFKYNINLLHYANGSYYNYDIDFVETYRITKINTSLSFDEIVKLPLSSNIDEVTILSELNDVYDYDFRTVYHKYKLKKGYYQFKLINFNYPNFTYTIYDKNKNKVEDTQIFNIERVGSNDFNKFFKIEKNGVYYIEITSKVSNLRMALSKVDYKDCFIENNVELEKNMHIKSQSKYHVLKFNLEEEGFIQLQTTAKQINVLCLTKDIYEEKMAYDTLNVVFKGQKGENILLIYKDFINCEILLSKLEVIGHEEKYEDLYEIKSEPSKELFAAGYGIFGGRVKIKVEEKSEFVFCENHINGTVQFFDYEINIYKNGKIEKISSNNFILYPGEYVINITKNEQYVTAGYIYYEQTILE